MHMHDGGIDPRTGAIGIEGFAEPIGPALSLKAFLRMTGMKDARASGPGSGYYLGVRGIGGRRCHVLVQYWGDMLEMVDLSLDGSELPPGAADDMQALHAAHRAWLRELMGPPSHPSSVGNDTHALTIGGIGACYDPRSDSASIVARYRWQGVAWVPG
jgi:hypothetical protein